MPLFSLYFFDIYASTLGSVLARVYLNRVKGFAQDWIRILILPNSQLMDHQRLNPEPRLVIHSIPVQPLGLGILYFIIKFYFIGPDIFQSA